MKKITNRAAFTLIELLVVIAIIGILASLLLPVLGRAKKKANTLKSVSNQGNIAKAYVMYLDDNEGWYPVVAGPASVGGKQGFAWGDGLKPLPDVVARLYGAKVPASERPLNKYIGNDEHSLNVFHDPSDVGGGAYSVPSCWESFGNSYQAQTADDMFRVKRVLGEKTEKDGSYEGTSMHEQEMENPVTKIIQGDWNWPYDREDSWHSDKGMAKHIMLYADGHVEQFTFPPTSTMTNWFLSPPPDPNYRWW
jgi:prepilin-type N-terminal cleavage/methylation domain-containing protein/prepilin-type processing-associated H-X9-DG protein|tara:strand:+ start:553 stop:1305 length:753 start_codon:yes stop_codon:yes gene_type:complete